MAQLAFSLLGPLLATRDGVPITGFESQKVRALLAYLVVEADRPHGRDALAGLLWPNQSDQDARNNLRQALANLRQVLGDQRATPPYLHITRETIQFNRASDHEIDVAAFTALLAACDRHPHRHPATCRSCMQRLQQAVDQYHGDFLAAFFLADSAAFEEWMLLKREWFHQHALAAFTQLASYHEQRGEYAHAQQHARRQVALDPWREESHRQLMRVLALDGQRSAALIQYATCQRVLDNELSVEPEPETTALYQQIQRGKVVPAVRARPTNNLAAHTPPTPLIGRETELTQIVDRLEDQHCRLLTLVGTGGIGKTRLALQVASDLGASFPDGVAFVALAPLPSDELVVPAIANALGFVFDGVLAPKTQLLAFLRTKEHLLVLDNVEHLLDLAPLVSELLATCPDLTLLATGRAPLRVRGEHQFPVPSLQLPNLAQLPDIDKLSQYAAVALFVVRAQAVQPAFQLTAVNAPAVAMICARLDGLPLAIELAAARSKLFVPAALLARLHAPLALLTGGARDLPTRQQTIRNTIAWSYNLLNDNEQQLFQQLGVFVGGCTLEAAEAVTKLNGRTVECSTILDGLAALVDKSLLRQTIGPRDELRFVMLETIREYAVEQLFASKELRLLQQRHAAFFVTWVEAVEDGHLLEAEYPNLRAALAWSQTVADGSIGLRLGRALGGFWRSRSYLNEGRAWLTAMLEPPADQASRPDMVAYQTLRAQALMEFGELAAWQSDLSTAQLVFEDCLAMFRQLGDPKNIAYALRDLGMTLVLQGDYNRSGLLIEESLVICRQLEDTHGMAECLAFLSARAYMYGDLARACEVANAALILARRNGATWAIASALLDISTAALDQADIDQVRANLNECIQQFRDIGERWNILRALEVCAHLVALRGAQHLVPITAIQSAVRIFGAAEALRETLYNPRQAIYCDQYQRGVAAARAHLSVKDFAAAWAAGRGLTLEQAIAEALNELA